MNGVRNLGVTEKSSGVLGSVRALAILRQLAHTSDYCARSNSVGFNREARQATMECGIYLNLIIIKSIAFYPMVLTATRIDGSALLGCD